LRRTIVIAYYNSGFIRSLSRGFFPSSRKGPTSGIGALVRVGAMTGEDGKTSGIEKFDGTDFGYWKMQIEDYLYGKKLHLPLLGKKPDKMEDAEWALLDRQVLGVIRLTLSRSVAHNVVKETTTVGLMTALSGMYEKPSANNKVH
jgi:hypothetical protein